MLSHLRDHQELARLKNSSRLVIAAHPDDETFWGGLALASGEWAAAVLTHRSTKWRKSAFETAMTIYGARGAIFNLPDKHWGPLNERELASMRALITKLVCLPKLTDVLTHSPDGESGHTFHKLISQLVTEYVRPDVRLHYFSFDEDFSAPRDEPELWRKKRAATDAYLAATPGVPGNDILHIRLSEHESPAVACDYIRPARLFRSIYSGSTVPNADIPDLSTSA